MQGNKSKMIQRYAMRCKHKTSSAMQYDAMQCNAIEWQIQCNARNITRSNVVM